MAGSLLGTGSDPTNNLRFFAGNGDGSFQSSTAFTGIANESATYLSAADLNGDGRPDLVFSVPNIGVVAFGNGDGTFQTSSNQFRYLPVPVFSGVSTIYAAPPVALADMDKDGTIDAVVIDPDTSTVNVDLNTDGLGDFPSDPNFSAAVPMGSTGLQLADLNGDGLPDIISTSYQTNEISVFLSILPKTTPTLTLGGSAGAVVVGTPLTITAKVTGTPVPSGTVTLYDGQTAIGTRTLDGSGQATFPPITLMSGQHALNATYSGDARYNGLPASAAAGNLTQNIVDVAIALPVSSQTISSGSSANFSVALTPTAAFTGTVVLTCVGLPAGFACPPVTASGNSATVTVTPPAMAAQAETVRYGGMHYACVLVGLCLLPLASRRNAVWMLGLVVLCVAATLTGCSSSKAATAKPYTGTTAFTITATVTQGASSLTHTASATLVVQ